ncbi:hypothetical protein MPTK1_7g02130 [Marchantia polymorpha subsp. ruderalis]|uniref:Uncharacterized protein n=2 Tax=Marchantia polymorpha TaxID=3197 RepID=A0AAF6BVA6_MARPO|nr:hypothetical protein MARPO_0088s0073 [Marchantia polymorpha]BBN15940.1 hypothetical protein Mp_7g02130 [Marchantia polymorpha subsp. ruderalis]|eukprot:PTQ33531.1 hypothetical protein MARPO_0088s0073 [Marchantia polymorpha]
MTGSERSSHLELLSLVLYSGDEGRLGELTLEDLRKKKIALASEVESAFQEMQRLKKMKFFTEERFTSVKSECTAVKTALNIQQEKECLLHAQINQATSELENMQAEHASMRNIIIETLQKLHLDLRRLHSADVNGCKKRKTENQSTIVGGWLVAME